MTAFLRPFLPYIAALAAAMALWGYISHLQSERDQYRAKYEAERLKAFVGGVTEKVLSWRVREQPKIIERIEYRDRIIRQEVAHDPEFQACERQSLPAEYVDSLWPSDATPDAP